MRRAILTVFCLMAPCGFAGDANTGRAGAELLAFSGGPLFAKGALFGFHHSQYFSNHYSYGYRIISGTPNGLRIEEDNLTAGGLTLGYDTVLNHLVHVEGELLIGYGYGSFGAGFALHPTLGAGLVAVDGWRIIFSLGFLQLQHLPASGITFSIKLDRKTSGSVTGKSD